MRVTVCELPWEPELLEPAWRALATHTLQERSELVVLPEFAFVEPVWEHETFDQARWDTAVAQARSWMCRLAQLQVPAVIGARPVTDGGRPFNEGFLWTASELRPLRRKYFLPDDEGGHERRWFDRGDAAFPQFQACALRFGLNICTELWALETYAPYASQGLHAIVSPRATGATTVPKWLAVGTVAAVRSGAYSLSSNRADGNGRYGGAGWVISPEGELLARTSAREPFATVHLDLQAVATARRAYPRNVF